MIDPGDKKTIPSALAGLAKQLQGKSLEAAKRLIVSTVGSVRRGERIEDDVADAVFLRVQQNAQVGRYASEEELVNLGRNAVRLTGDGIIKLYRYAPKGAGIRPGDFATGSAWEAGFYSHGGHVMHKLQVKRSDVFQVDGSMGGGKEYVFLPEGYVRPTPVVFFSSFATFYAAAQEAVLKDKKKPTAITGLGM